MKVYLAGPIFQCEDHECISWREEAKEQLKGFEVMDPMERDFRGAEAENYRRIVEEDKRLIDGADILLVNQVKVSVGTSMEILYAWQNGKRVVVVTENGGNSPWLLYHAHKILRSLDEAVSYIRSL
jgi:nucleoside 2-deoxyribosyltransferase